MRQGSLQNSVMTRYCVASLSSGSVRIRIMGQAPPRSKSAWQLGRTLTLSQHANLHRVGEIILSQLALALFLGGPMSAGWRSKIATEAAGINQRTPGRCSTGRTTHAQPSWGLEYESQRPKVVDIPLATGVRLRPMGRSVPIGPIPGSTFISRFSIHVKEYI